MADTSEDAATYRPFVFLFLALQVILFGYWLRDYAAGRATIWSLAISVGGLALGLAVLVGPQRRRSYWALFATAMVANAVWILRAAT